MKRKPVIVRKRFSDPHEGHFHTFEYLYHSDEDFRSGFPVDAFPWRVSKRTLTAEERDKIVAAGDPGVIQWPQLMLRPHTGDTDD